MTAQSEAPDDLVVTFDRAGTFEAMQAAEDWCRARGVAFGSSERGSPRGLMVGDYAIAKWRNLSPKERRQCHGTMTGDGRYGPITIRISRAALAGAQP